MNGQVLRFIVPHRHAGNLEGNAAQHEGIQKKCRLDLFLTNQDTLPCSRSHIRKLILEGEVTVNGQIEKAGYGVKAADEVIIRLPEARPSELIAEAMPLHILFEDDEVIVVNKPAGLVVHPAPGHYTGTLVHGLLHHCPTLPGIGGVQRPGIVHRLDRDTSGVMLVAKTDHAHHALSEQLKRRDVSRIYISVVHGRFHALSGQIEAPIGRHRAHRKKMAVDLEKGRYACSLYRILEQYPEYALVQVELKTGRTHQIRVHMQSIHHPVVGDAVYGNSSKHHLHIGRQALHAMRLKFQHPSNGAAMEFEAPLPEDMQQVLDTLRGNQF